MKNHLEIDAAEFKLATKIFTPKRRKLGPALLAFEGGFLSIESGEATAVMRASGEWHGRATFSPEILRALAMHPPTQNPLKVAYADGVLVLGSMKIPCKWGNVSQAFIHDLQNPSLIDQLVLERSLPRAEIGSTGLGRKVRNAQMKMDRRINKAAEQLVDLEITANDLREMVEKKIQARLL